MESQPAHSQAQPETLHTSLQHSLLEIQALWGLADERLAELTHVDLEKLRAWLRATNQDGEAPTATIPAGMDSVPPVITIQRCLAEKLSDPEKQVQWLTTPHPDFGNHAPWEIATSSPQNLAWLAYYLESNRTAHK